MKFFDRMTDKFFLVDENGQTIFYPCGKYAKGYLIPSKNDEKKHRKFISIINIIFFSLLFLLGVTVGWIFGIVLLPAYCLAILLWVRKSTKGFNERPPASQTRLYWIIYFWGLLLLSVIGIMKQGINGKTVINGTMDAIDTLLSIGAFLGLGLYSYRQRLFTRTFWKIFCLAFISFDAFYNIFIEPTYHNESYALQKNLVAFPFILPLYIALYLHAFKFMSEDENGKRQEDPVYR